MALIPSDEPKERLNGPLKWEKLLWAAALNLRAASATCSQGLRAYARHTPWYAHWCPAPHRPNHAAPLPPPARSSVMSKCGKRLYVYIIVIFYKRNLLSHILLSHLFRGNLLVAGVGHLKGGHTPGQGPVLLRKGLDGAYELPQQSVHVDIAIGCGVGAQCRRHVTSGENTPVTHALILSSETVTHADTAGRPG